jgi:5-methylcytosine-specific restriction endonuclease McrA
MGAVKSLHFSENNLIEIQNVILQSHSIRTVLLAMNIVPAGGNYRTFQLFVKKHNIDVSHFTGQGHNKHKTGCDRKGGRTSTLDRMISNPYTQSFKLKRKLLKDGIFTHCCTYCNLTHWLNNPIPLELDHINGDSTDNRLDNLRLLCPNCHALTPTYRGKNINSQT